MVTVALGLVADYANISREGKPNIMGIFDNVLAPSTPASHPSMALIFVLEAEKGDAGREHPLKIELVDEDGNKLMTMESVMSFEKPKPGQYKLKANQIINLNNLQFPKFGTYNFNIFINNEVRKNIPLSVIKLEAPKK